MTALENQAAHLNSICAADPNAVVCYDVLSDALIWSDETNESTSIEVIHALRQLRHYRTHVMLKNIEPDNDVWRGCYSLFPDWVGFQRERRIPTPELLAEYRRGNISTKRCIRKLEMEMDASDA